MKRLVYSPAALADLREIAAHIADDNPDRAKTFVDELCRKADQAAERPMSFPARDEISTGLRSVVHRNYLILFRDLPGHVRIVRVLHGSRDLYRVFGE